MNKSRRSRPELVNPLAAARALENAGGDRHRAYSQYILMMYRATGSLACGVDNRDLQAWYDARETPS